MKKFYSFFAIVIIGLTFISCDKINSLFEDDKKNDPNTIGGDTNLPVSQVGNTATASGVIVGDQVYDANASFQVTKNENGVATIKVQADISKIPGAQVFNNFIPSSMKDSNGKINTEVKLKMTSEGIQDYFNRDYKVHTIAKYECNVGDQYKLSKSDGKTITRTVTAKSTTDDTPYGFFNIKAITVEQDSRVPGIKKFIYKVNHKFGLVYFEVVGEDNSSAAMYFYPQNY